MIEVRLQILMRERGVGIVALAQRAGVHTTQLYTLLRQPDRVHLKTLDKVCRALGVTPGDVLVQIDDSSEYAPSNGP
jgi:DNA-binding Xre family transcriptional regulator